MRSRFIQRAVRANPCLCLASPRRLTCIPQLLMTSSFVGGGGGFLCQVKCHGRGWQMISLASMWLATLPFLAGLIPLGGAGGGGFVMAQSRWPCSSCFISPPPLQRCCRGEALFARFASAAPDFFFFFGEGGGAMWMNLISFVSPTNHTTGQRFSL